MVVDWMTVSVDQTCRGLAPAILNADDSTGRCTPHPGRPPARSEDLTLVSNNLREFDRIEGPPTENWLAP
jgi:hypothetical protein